MANPSLGPKSPVEQTLLNQHAAGRNERIAAAAQSGPSDVLAGRIVDDHAAEARVIVRNLRKAYRTRRGEHVALDNVSLRIGAGEFVVLLGPSGCGKTTLLRCVAGLERPDAGEIIVNGRTVFSSEQGIWLPPEQRHLSMVFQSYALWPHMTVADNIAYPLRNARVAETEVSKRVRSVLEVVGLDAYGSAYPGQLSGGQQQRVALARAIVGSDGLILFDEPLSNLDAKVRERLRVELLALQKEMGFSALYVTHDQVEALALADRIAVMAAGRIAQVGGPVDIYSQPTSRYVADFVGTANEVQGTIIGREGEYYMVETSLGPIAGMAGTPALGIGQSVSVMFRPQHCRISAGAETAAVGNSVRGRVERSLFLGTHIEYVVSANGCSLVLTGTDGDALMPGEEIRISFEAQLTRIFAVPGDRA